MGYTHYFTRHKRRIVLSAWEQIVEDVGEILKHAQHVQGVTLAREYDAPGSAPAVTRNFIQFNGLGENGCETFIIRRLESGKIEYRDHNPLADFCKTAREPYDIAVVAVLCYLCSVAETHTASSDGDLKDWTAGLEMAKLALPRYANVLDYPRAMLEGERWVAPWIDTRHSGYEVNFCVDGRAYIIRERDGATFCWPSHADAAVWLTANREGGYKPRHMPLRGERHRESSTYEPNLWSASGSFDKARFERIGKWQAAKLAPLVAAAASRGRDQKPPAFVRPGDFPQFETDDAPFHYYLEDILKPRAA